MSVSQRVARLVAPVASVAMQLPPDVDDHDGAVGVGVGLGIDGRARPAQTVRTPMQYDMGPQQDGEVTLASKSSNVAEEVKVPATSNLMLT